MNEETEKPKMSVEVDGKVIFKVEIDEDNFDFIRAARRLDETKSTDNDQDN